LIFQSIANIIESFDCLVNLYLKHLIITIYIKFGLLAQCKLKNFKILIFYLKKLW